MFAGSDGPPPLVDADRGFIPPPAGATMGGQPSGGWPPEHAGGYTPFNQNQSQPPPWFYQDQQNQQMQAQMQMHGRYPSFNGPPTHQPSTPYAPFSPHSPWSAPTPGASHSYGTPGGSFGGPTTPVSAGHGHGPPGATRDDPWGIAAAQQVAGMVPPTEHHDPPGHGWGHGHGHGHGHHTPHGHDQAVGPGWFNGHRPSTPFIGTPKRKKSKRGHSRPTTPFAHGFADDDDDDDPFTGGGGGFGLNGGGGGGGGFPLHRAKSAGAVPNGMGMGGVPGYKMPMYPFGGYPQEFGEGNLARRPRDWRADFDARQGIAGFLAKKHKSNVKEWYDTEKRYLTPLLEYKPEKPNIFYDLRHTFYQFDRPVLWFPTLKRQANQIDLHQLATNPPCPHMRVFHPMLPWYVDVHQSNENGITLEDVLFQLHRQLSEPINDKDFWTDAVPDDMRIKISVVFSKRVQGENGESWKEGIKRVDYLRDHCIFEGLVRSKGMWEVKTRHLDEYNGFRP